MTPLSGSHPGSSRPSIAARMGAHPLARRRCLHLSPRVMGAGGRADRVIGAIAPTALIATVATIRIA